MLDIFRDGAEAWLQRVKSPLLGSILLVFFGWNWKPIYFVLFSDAPIVLRYWYFDHQTSAFSLGVLPITLGIIIGLMTPFINYFGSYVAKWPTEKLRVLTAESADAVMTAKAELLIKREIAAAEFKEAALKNAQATQAIEDADLDQATRLELERKVEDPVVVNAKPKESDLVLTDIQKAVIECLAKSGGHDFSPSDVWLEISAEDIELPDLYARSPKKRLEVDVNEALSQLELMKLTESVYNSRSVDGIQLSAKGYRVHDTFKAKPLND